MTSITDFHQCPHLISHEDKQTTRLATAFVNQGNPACRRLLKQSERTRGAMHTGNKGGNSNWSLVTVAGYLGVNHVKV